MNFKNILIIFSILIVLSLSLNGVSAISNDSSNLGLNDNSDMDLISSTENSTENITNNSTENSTFIGENISDNMSSLNDSVDTNGSNSSNVSDVNDTNVSTMNNGMWLFSTDLNNVNLKLMAEYGINHIFLNYAVFSKYKLSYIESWISTAGSYGIKVHIWMQVFYSDGKWVSPVSNGKFNTAFFNKKINEALKYAAVTGVAGIHLDYLRFPGTAYKYKNATDSINYFVKQLSTKVKAKYPNIILSAAVMPESLTTDKYYYGQDIVTLSGYLDVICPMAYKGNYNKDTDWINTVTKRFVSASTHAEIWAGLQTYKSDSNLVKLSTSELYKDCRAAITGGADGFVLFRYGLTNFFNFRSCYDNILKVKFSASSLVTTYKSGKYFKINVTSSNKPVANLKLRLNVYTGTTYKSVIVTTNSEGIAYYYGSSLSIGKHKIYINAYDTSEVIVNPITSYITVNKGITNVTAPTVKNKYKQKAYFKATVINKASGKIISGLALKVKVYTGKKYKTYSIKTNAKGIAYLNTKLFSKGTHKVVITSGNSKYTVSKTSYIKIV